MSNLESILQQTIVNAIRTLYPKFVINLSLNGISLAGLSPVQKAQIIAQAKREGMENGIQDFSLYVSNGKVLNFELKTDKGKQSDDQELIQAKLTELGHNYYLVRDMYTVFSIIADNVTKSDRIDAFYALPIHYESRTLTNQFLYFEPGTDIQLVHDEIKKLYHI